jgi:hypothetical protein
MATKQINVYIPLWVYTQFVCKLKSEKGLKASINGAIVQLIKDELGKEEVLAPHVPKYSRKLLLVKAERDYRRWIDIKVQRGKHFKRNTQEFTKKEIRAYRRQQLDKIFGQKRK